jgi:acetyl esterase/lipase
MEAFGISREFCALVAASTQCVVFDADYSKAPKHPFPAAIQDAEDVVLYVARNSDRYDSSNIFLSGFSSGGNIALVTASTLGPERVKGVIGFYPIVDLTKQHTAPEKRVLAGYTIPQFIYDACFGTYIPPGHPRDDPRISVISAPTESFPRHVYLSCGDADLLYTPAAKFVEKLKKAGHMDAEFVGLERMGHSFDMFENNIEAVRNKAKAYGGAVEMINRAIGTRGGPGSDFGEDFFC